MTQKNFNTITGVLFILVAAFHLWRIVAGYPITFGEAFIPMWLSWLALILGLVLGFYGIKHGKVSKR